MISFIKLFSCHSVFPAAAHAVEVIFLLVDINSDEFLTFMKDEWICVGVCSWDLDVLSFFVHFLVVAALNIIC
jgi:hypothetical protein